MRFMWCSLVLLVAIPALAVRADAPFDVHIASEAQTPSGTVLTVTYVVPPQHYLYAHTLRVAANPPHVLAPLDIPAPVRKLDPLTQEETSLYHESFTARYFLTGPPTTTVVTVQYQGCSAAELICFPPVTRHFNVSPNGMISAVVRPATLGAPLDADWQTLARGFRVVGTASGYLAARDFLAFLDRAEGSAPPEESVLSRFQRQRIWLSLLLILLGGVALNLTPCVLPMIPVNLAVLGAGARAGSRMRGFFLGAMYGAGMALAYGTLGVVVALTGAQFGTLNASPWFNLAVALLFGVLALAMCDVITIDFTRYRGQIAVAPKQGSLIVAFVLGAIAALLAGACVAPVVIQVLVLAMDMYARGLWAGMLLPFILGLGMALPWPLAGAGLTLLPKPGAWMNKVKYAFGALIFIIALWYGYEGVRLLRARSRVVSPTPSAHPGWVTSLVEGLTIAQRTRQPVFLDFWASWCKNCLAMDATTFRNARVNERLVRYIKIKYIAEVPTQSPTKEILAYFGVKGLPTFLILQPESTSP
ncbi:MAG: protein-disulfide reductase DsbD family protein [bacterium]|nr:protein-disulfide reductase DsbD family protein [bacterium]